MKAQRLPDDGQPINGAFHARVASSRAALMATRESWEPVTAIRGGNLPPLIVRFKIKPCIRCGDDFDTRGFHNRLCDNCTVLVAKRQDAGIFWEGVSIASNGGNKRRHGGS